MKDKKVDSKNIYFSERLRIELAKMTEYPLTVIEAPMGYGKTTAVKEYLNKTGAAVLWQTVQDGFAAGFWHNFSGLFRELDKTCALNLARLGIPLDGLARQEVHNMIKSIKLQQKTFIVIDDYYRINQAEIHSLISFLVLNKIENLHIVITTRLVLLDNLDEMKLKGYAHHITKETLELNKEEINLYFRSCGIRLKDAEIEQLYTYTEGWISALYLSMLYLLKEGGWSGKQPEFAGLLLPDINSLVEKAVYKPFSQEIREFLLTMCIFDNFSAEQAAFMWLKHNSADLLAELMAKNAFLRYDRKSKEYRLHNILVNFLADMLDKKDLSDKQDLYQRAGQWHLKAAEYLPAMQYFYFAGNFDDLLKAVELDKSNSINFEQKETFIRYFEQCPQQTKKRHPIALLVFAMCFITYNETELFAKVCVAIIDLLQEKPCLEADMDSRIRGEFELLLSFTEYNNIRKMSEHHQTACKLLKQPATFIDTKGGWAFGSPSVLYLFHRESGKLAEEVRELKEAMPYYYQLTGGHGMGAETVMEAEWYYNTGDFENAEIFAYRALYLAEKHVQSEIIVCALFVLVRTALTKGAALEAQALVKKMRETVKQKGMYFLLYTIDLCEAFLYASLKQSYRLTSWEAEGDLKSNHLLFQAKAFSNIVYGRVLLITGNDLKLLGIAENFTDIASVFHNLLAKIYTDIYVAAANQRIYRTSEALTALKQALEAAALDRVYMPFVENGDYLKPLWEQLYHEGFYREDIARIMALYAEYERSLKQITDEYFTTANQPLTEREKEIALLAADGLSNKEISERLFISTNTVKTQLKKVFEKLRVSSRSLLKQELSSRNEQL